jgi:hypothetical protein
LGAKVGFLGGKTILMAKFAFLTGNLQVVKLFLNTAVLQNLLNLMLKFYLILVIAIGSSSLVVAQTDSLSQKDKAALDSMLENDEFLKMMKGEAKNSFDVSIGIGNGAFSSHNNAANATGVDNKMIFTPSLVYRTKTGFSFGVTGYLTSDSISSFNLYQTGLSAGYDYTGKQVNAGLTYTRYLSDKNKYNNNSLYQNDIYGYIKRAKGIIQPGLTLGFDNGEYKEAVFQKFSKKIHRLLPLPNGSDTTIIISGIDSTHNKTSYFSVSANIEHDFSFYKLFNKDDELDFVPSLILNMGSDKLTQTHLNKVFDRKVLSNRKKIEATNKFQVQSVAASFDFTYGVGKFFLQPNLYLDYYLPETTAKRFTAIFSVTTGFSF